MLNKDPEQRITIAELKKNAGLNEGFHVSLDSDEAKTGVMSHFKSDENAQVPQKTIEYARKLA